MDAFKAAWKFVRSFFTSGWELSDYPIRIKQFDPAPGPHGRSGPPFTWSAQVINWWAMAGHGCSRDEAMQSLVESFERRKTASEPLPRPGTEVPEPMGHRLSSSCWQAALPPNHQRRHKMAQHPARPESLAGRSKVAWRRLGGVAAAERQYR
jgi:hypothetical protein